MAPSTIVHIGIDESGSLSAAAPVFVVAAVLTTNPETTRSLIRRAAIHSGKHLGRTSKRPSELKWNTASNRIKEDVLGRIAENDLKLFAIVIQKEGRRIEDTPENFAYLICEILSLMWHDYPELNVLLDRHFTSPSQIAHVDTILYRHLPRENTLALTHVDSQRSTLVQLADFVAGSIYEFHKRQSLDYRIIEEKIKITSKSWQILKAEWLTKGK